MIKITGLGAPLGDEKLSFKGRLAFPPGVPSGFDPSANGAQVLIEDLGSGAAAVFNLTYLTTPVPPTAPGTGCDSSRDGWKTNKPKTRHKYKNKSGAINPPVCTAGSAKGLNLIKFKDERAAKGVIAFIVKTKDSALSQPVGPLRGTIVSGATSAESAGGQCGTVTFSPSACRYNPNGSTLTCK